ncbi:hypothetical protein OBBRIDRAFT_808284, partial [Obba rivulosa]
LTCEAPYSSYQSQMLSGTQWPMEDALPGCFQDPFPSLPNSAPKVHAAAHEWLQHHAKVVKYLPHVLGKSNQAVLSETSCGTCVLMMSNSKLMSVMLLSAPEEILKLKNKCGTLAAIDSANYINYSELPSGLMNLIRHVKSHPNVAEEHYHDLFKQFLPDSMPL